MIRTITSPDEMQLSEVCANAKSTKKKPLLNTADDNNVDATERMRDTVAYTAVFTQVVDTEYS